jgi:hypothetical protein
LGINRSRGFESKSTEKGEHFLREKEYCTATGIPKPCPTLGPAPTFPMGPSGIACWHVNLAYLNILDLS